MLILGAILLPLFVYTIITSNRFWKSDESKGERGQMITIHSYKYAFMILY